MDNFTLLVTLNLVLFSQIIFTFIITRSADELPTGEWRVASVLVLTGFFLLLMQRYLYPFISIIVANYAILAGLYLQISASLTVVFRQKKKIRYLFPAFSSVYLIFFLLFTYVNFNTSARISVISALLALLYAYGGVQIRGRKKDARGNGPEYTEIVILYYFSSGFYLLRLILTVLGPGAVKSLFDFNLLTTATFIYLIIYNLVYLMSMLSMSLRYKSYLALNEKEKLSYLFRFLNDTAKHLDLMDLYETIGKTLKESIGVDSTAVYLVDSSDRGHYLAYIYNESNFPRDIIGRFNKGEGLSGQAIEKDEVIELDAELYPIKDVKEVLLSKGVKYLAGAPLKTPGGIIGAITVVFTSYDKKDLLDRNFLYRLKMHL